MVIRPFGASPFTAVARRAGDRCRCQSNVLIASSGSLPGPGPGSARPPRPVGERWCAKCVTPNPLKPVARTSQAPDSPGRQRPARAGRDEAGSGDETFAPLTPRAGSRQVPPTRPSGPSGLSQELEPEPISSSIGVASSGAAIGPTAFHSRKDMDTAWVSSEPSTWSSVSSAASTQTSTSAPSSVTR